MRKRKTIKLDDREITVFEATVEDLMSLDKLSSGNMAESLESVLPRFTDLPLADLKAMAPSELEQLWEAFKEVNAVFFGMAAKMGITRMLTDSIRNILNASFAASLKEGMPGPGNTDSGSSLLQ